jgi:hypothetical protein
VPIACAQRAGAAPALSPPPSDAEIGHGAKFTFAELAGAGRTENLLLSDIWRTGGNCVTVIRGLSFCPILHVANHPLMGPPGLAGSFVYGRSQAILANRTDDSHAQTRERE